MARKAVFALSCLVRGFPYGQQVLVQNGGLEVLRKVFDRGDFQSMPLQLKVSYKISQKGSGLLSLFRCQLFFFFF